MITTNLRFPDEELHKAIKKSAENNRRSLNNEILFAISAYLELVPLAKYEVKPAKEVKPKKSPK